MKQITITEEEFVTAAKFAIGEALHNMPKPNAAGSVEALVEYMASAVQASIVLGLGMRLLKRQLFEEPRQTAQDAVEAAQKLLDNNELGNEEEAP
jgi:hypothetical protein